MYTYRKDFLLNEISKVFHNTADPRAADWLAAQTFPLSVDDTSGFYMAFTAAPRHTGKSLVVITKENSEAISDILPGFSVNGYTTDRLARVILLLNFSSEDKNNYINTITELFKAGEVNELVALYGALPLLAYAEEWVEQCREGIRSNIGSVLETIICDNPYPAQYLSEPAWNQLVLKAFFTDKPVERIVGLDRRANRPLAETLIDYAHERWAAGRTFDLQLWRLVSAFIDGKIFQDMQRVFRTCSALEKDAIVLASIKSSYAPATALAESVPDIRARVINNELNWESVAKSGKAFDSL